MNVTRDAFLKLSGKIKHEIIIFDNCINIQPFQNTFVFSKAKRLIFDTCDPNFTYYWLNRERFPCLRVIYTNYPIEVNVLNRFDEKIIVYATTDVFNIYYRNSKSNVKSLGEDHFDLMIDLSKSKKKE
jgi:hypothetical protein